MTITTDLGSQTIEEIQGLHEANQTSLEDLKLTLNKILEIVTGLSSGSATESFIKNIGDSLEKTVGNEDSKDKGDGKGAPSSGNDKPKIGLNIKPQDLSNLSASATMGALLVNSTLFEIQKRLDTLIKNITTAGNKNAGSITNTGTIKKQTNKTTNVENQTNINFDPKQVSGMAKALLEFGKACVILAIVPEKIVTKALGTFKKFIETMTAAANNLIKSGKDFEEFAIGLVKIVNAMKTYSVAVIVLALVLPLTPFALASIAVLSLMVQMLSKIGKDAMVASKYLPKITEAMVQAGVAFILFGVAMMIAVKVGQQALDAIKGVLVMVSFLAIMVVLGIACFYANLAIGQMAITFMSLAGAILLFGLAIKLMSKIEIKQDVINNFITAIYTITSTLASMAGTIIRALGSVVVLLLFSALFTSSLLLLTLGAVFMMALDKIFSGLAIDDETGNFVVIEDIKRIGHQFGNPETIIFFSLALVAMVPAILFSVLFTTTMIVMTIGVLLLYAMNMMLDKIMVGEGEERTCKPISDIILIMKLFAGSLETIALGTLAVIPATIFAAALMAFSVASLVAVAALVEVGKLINKLGTPKEIKSMGTKLMESGIGIMLSFLGIDHEAGQEIGVGILAKAAINGAKLLALGVAATAAIIPVATFMTAAATIGKSLVYLNDNLSEINMDMIERVFGMLGGIMTNLSAFAVQMSATSSETIIAISELVKGVAEAVNMLVDIVVKLKDGIPEEQIDAATASMNRICERLFGAPGMANKPGEYTLTTTLETIASANLQDLNKQAVESIVPLIDGIDRMCDIVLRLSNEDVFSEAVIKKGSDNLRNFLALMVDVADTLTNLIKKQGTGEREKAGGIKGFFGGTNEVMKSPLEAVDEVIASGFFNSMEQVFNGLGNLADMIATIDPTKMTGMVEFMSNNNIQVMATNAPLFCNAMTQFATGLGKLTVDGVNNFTKFIDTLAKTNVDNMVRTVNALQALGNAASQFKSVADSFDRMADALSTMVKHENKITKIFDSMKKGGESGSALANSSVNAVGGTTFDPYVEKIYNVLDDWNSNGVPLRGDNSGNLAPIPAGNATGFGTNR